MARLEDLVAQIPDPRLRREIEAGLADFKRRFRETNTEEGRVMETVLAYAMDQAYTSTRRALLTEYRNSERIRWLIASGVLELDAMRQAAASRAAPARMLSEPGAEVHASER